MFDKGIENYNSEIVWPISAIVRLLLRFWWGYNRDLLCFGLFQVGLDFFGVDWNLKTCPLANLANFHSRNCTFQSKTRSLICHSYWISWKAFHSCENCWFLRILFGQFYIMFRIFTVSEMLEQCRLNRKDYVLPLILHWKIRFLGITKFTS